MGNINGREDGSNSSITNDVTIEPATAVADDDADFMGHSPPPSPRVSGSPLLFTPQVSLFIYF